MLLDRSSDMTNQPKTVSVTVELTDAEAYHLAQFLKRVTFQDFMANAQDKDEAHAMCGAAERVRLAFAQAGYAPR